MKNELPDSLDIDLVVLDWAGTMIDHGSLAPMHVFVELFAERGVSVSVDQARGPMGMAKREHIAALLAQPEVSKAWQKVHGRMPGESDIDAIYADFHPKQMATIQAYCEPIAGVVQAVQTLRDAGVAIGSTTGYTRHIMEVVVAEAQKSGLITDSMRCADDTPFGRPAPWLIYETARQFNVYPMTRVLKVDDTTIGIEAGRNAGAWTVGISRTGNLVGLSESAFMGLTPQEQQAKVAAAEQILLDAGAHAVIETLADLPLLLKLPNGRSVMPASNR